MFRRPCATIKSSASALQARAFHGTYLDPNLEIQIPLQVAAEREIARSYFAAAPGGRTLAAADWNVNITEFAHPPVIALNKSQLPAACARGTHCTRWRASLYLGKVKPSWQLLLLSSSPPCMRWRAVLRNVQISTNASHSAACR